MSDTESEDMAVYTDLYQWIDALPLSGRRGIFARDFSDGFKAAEVVSHYFPKRVELHNYPRVAKIDKKRVNWKTLNRKVFRRMGFEISQDDIDAVVTHERYAAENVMLFIREQMEEYADQLESRRKGGSGGGGGGRSLSPDRRSNRDRDRDRDRPSPRHRKSGSAASNGGGAGGSEHSSPPVSGRQAAAGAGVAAGAASAASSLPASESKSVNDMGRYRSASSTNPRDFRAERWYDTLREYTARTAFVDVTYAEAVAMLARHLVTVTGEPHGMPKAALKEARAQPKEVTEQNLARVAERVEREGTRYKDGFFCKLNTVSPKDACVYGFRRGMMEQRLASKLKGHDRSANQETVAFVSSCLELMRVHSGAEAVTQMVHSRRVALDLARAIAAESGRSNRGPIRKIVVREWHDLKPEYLLRGFVHGRQLNALTQYAAFAYWPELAERRKRITAQVLDFFDQFRDKIPYENIVIDFSVEEDNVMIVELSPFADTTSPGLFRWDQHRSILEDGPFQLRVVEKVSKDIREQVHPDWRRYIDSLPKESGGCCVVM